MDRVEPTSPLVASALLAPLFDGPPRSLHVIHRCASACQLADNTGVVRACAVTAAALRFPHAVVLQLLPDGASLAVGDGLLRWGGATFAVARWWRPARPRLPALRSRLRDVPLDDLVGSWRDRLGEGPGLTPYADDVLCGVLVSLHAAGHPRADALSAQVLATPLKHSTSATSAALLRLAAGGWCIDAVADYLTALASGVDLAPVERTLRLVGSSSGLGLLEGIAAVVGEAPVDQVA